MSKEGCEICRLKLAQLEEGIVGKECRGGCKNKLGGEKALTILYRAQYVFFDRFNSVDCVF